MKQIIRILPFLTILILCSCSNNAQTADHIAQDISPNSFNEKLQSLEDFQLVDVRRPDEWSEGVIANAITINWFDENFAEQIAMLDQQKPVLVYCASGGRSGKAMDLMLEQGFVEVYNLDGGIGAWKSAGLPTVK